MSRTDHEDAVARALDLLPPGDEAGSDPRLLRHPDLVEEARSTKEAAADVWLATSPLRAAPPDVLHSVMTRIESQAPLASRRRGFFPWLAASGWAAAAVAMILWPKDEETRWQTVVVKPDAPSAGQPEIATSQPAPTRRFSSEERHLKREFLKLRATLDRINDDGYLAVPRLMSLSSPGAITPTPEEARQRLWSVVTEAMRVKLEAQSGVSDESTALVIEQGWLPNSLSAPDEGKVYRHRNFPESSWQAFGLMRAEDGSYYDPSREMVWTMDSQGRGFVGRRSDEGDDLAAYSDTDPGSAIATNEPRTQPEGFVIEDPVANVAEVVIDQVPAPEEGNEHLVVWKDASGVESSVRVGSPEITDSSALTLSAVAPPAVIQTQVGVSSSGVLLNSIVFTIPSSGGVQSFQLIEAPIKPNGKPRKVIVTGGRSAPNSRAAMTAKGR